MLSRARVELCLRRSPGQQLLWLPRLLLRTGQPQLRLHLSYSATPGASIRTNQTYLSEVISSCCGEGVTEKAIRELSWNPTP